MNVRPSLLTSLTAQKIQLLVDVLLNSESLRNLSKEQVLCFRKHSNELISLRKANLMIQRKGSAPVGTQITLD